MNYPLWEVPYLTGGGLIAIVAILHVVIAHFAVGGGLFLVLTERMALQENHPDILQYVRRHTQFFVLLTLTLGALTGVGIWFSIAMVTPTATALLLRTFVWFWACEFVAFLVEITSLLVYHQTWDLLPPRIHQRVGWIYFFSAWASLFIINGILTFMLTPGEWLKTRNVWQAFINPTMLPSLGLRTFSALALAGLYALITSSYQQKEEVRNRLIQYSAQWLWPAFVGMPIFGAWYLVRIPSYARQEVIGGSPVILVFVSLSVVFSFLIFLFSYLGPYREPHRFSGSLALLFLLMGFVVTGTSEWVREAVRKPYLIAGFLYSNQIYPSQREEIEKKGILKVAKWTGVKEIEPGKEGIAGQEIFRLECGSCHAKRGYNGLQPMIAGWSESYLDTQLQHLETLKGFMPPFMGTPEERQALTKYLSQLTQASSPLMEKEDLVQRRNTQ